MLFILSPPFAVFPLKPPEFLPLADDGGERRS